MTDRAPSDEWPLRAGDSSVRREREVEETIPETEFSGTPDVEDGDEESGLAREPLAVGLALAGGFYAGSLLSPPESISAVVLVAVLSTLLITPSWEPVWQPWGYR